MDLAPFGVQQLPLEHFDVFKRLFISKPTLDVLWRILVVPELFSELELEED